MKTEQVVVPAVAGKIKKVRLVKLSDNPIENVSKFACARLNKVVSNIRVFGNCFGSRYSWKAEQIDTAEAALTAAVARAIDNLRTGKKIVDAGIKL